MSLMNAYPIDPADLRAALGTCMKSTELQALFKGAPEGANTVSVAVKYESPANKTTN